MPAISRVITWSRKLLDEVSLRGKLSAQLAAAKETKVAITRAEAAARRAVRRTRAGVSSYQKQKTRRAVQLLSLIRIYSRDDEDVVGLAAAFVGGTSVEEILSSAWVACQASPWRASREPRHMQQAREEARQAPCSRDAQRAQLLVAEARTAVWVTRVNQRGVAPLAEHMAEKVLAFWPNVEGCTLDAVFQNRFRLSPARRKLRARQFRARWNLEFKALPVRSALEPDVRRRRVL